MTLRLPGPAAACLLLLIAPGLRAADTVDLRWQLQKGQVLKYFVKHHEVRLTEVVDQKFETTTNVEYEWQLTVKDVDAAGAASVELKRNALRVEANGKEFAFRYDSSRGNDAEDKYGKDLKNFYDQMRFAAYRLQLKPDGRVAEVYGFDKLLGETTAGTQVAEFNAYWLHDDSFAWFLQVALGVLPEKGAKRDARWKFPATAKFKDVGESSGELEFTLDKPATAGGRTLEQIKMTGRHAVELNMPFGNSTISGKLATGKLSGVVRFDGKTGLVEGGEYAADYAGELKFGTGDQPLILKVTLRNEVTLERKP